MSAGVTSDTRQRANQDAENEQAISAIDDDVRVTALGPVLSREIRRLFGLLAAAAAVFALFYLTPIGSIASDVQSLRAYLKGDDLWAELSFAALAAALVAVGAPRLVFYGVGGLAFGFWQGLILAQLGCLCGAFLTFYAIRHGGRDWLLRRFGQHSFIGRAFRVRSSIKAVVLIRQLPLHGIMITGGLALSRVSARAFLIGTFLGFLPQGMITALLTSGVVDAQAAEGLRNLVIAAVILSASLGLLYLWRRRGSGEQS